MATIPATVVRIKQLTATVCSVAEKLQTFLGGVTESSSSRHKDLRRLKAILENLTTISRKLAVHASESLSLSGDQATEDHRHDGGNDDDSDIFLEFVAMLNGCKADLESLQAIMDRINSVSCHIAGCCFGQRARLYLNRKKIAESMRKLEGQRASLQLALVIVCRDIKHQRALQALQARIAALTDQEARSRQSQLSPPGHEYVSDDELTKNSDHRDAKPEVDVCSVKSSVKFAAEPSVKSSVGVAGEERDVEQDKVAVQGVGFVEDAERAGEGYDPVGDAERTGEGYGLVGDAEKAGEGGGLVEDVDIDGEGDVYGKGGDDSNAIETPGLAIDKEAARYSPLPPSPPPSEPPSPSPSHNPLPPPALPPPDLDPALKTLHPPTTATEPEPLPLPPTRSNWRLSTSSDRDSSSNFYYYPSYWTCCACSGGPYSGTCLVDCSVCGHRECVHCVEF